MIGALKMSGKSKNPISLTKWIWRSYLKTALVPIILIELLFIGIFFGINFMMRDKLTGLINTAVDKQMSKLVSLEAASIDSQLKNIEISTKSFAALFERALQTPAELSSEDVHRLASSPDGAYYTTGDSGGAALYYSGIVPVGDAEREKAARALSMQSLMKDIYDTNPLISSIYLNTYDSLNVIYPYFNVSEQYVPEIDVTTFNFYYEADAEHNPARTVRWTDIYLDPAGRGWMTSLIAPVYNGDVLEGVVGADVSVGNMINQLLNTEIPADGYALLAGSDGTILALTDNGIKDWKLGELPGYGASVTKDTFMPDTFNLSKMPEMSEFTEELSVNSSGASTLTIGNGDKRVTWETIGRTGWKLILFVPEKSILGTIDRVGSGLQEIGIIMTAGLLVFFAVFFRTLLVRARKMSENLSAPLMQLDNAAQDIGAGNYYQQVPEFEVKELQETSESIVNMGRRLGEINGNLLTAQNELKEKKSYLEAIISSIDDAIVELDENGLIVDLNINDSRYTQVNISPGYSSLDSIFPPEKAGMILQKLKTVVETGERETLETDVDTELGTRWVVCRFSLVSRDPVRVVVTTRDITERKEMEETNRKALVDAEAASRAKSQFLSNMSHELRTPLNAVLGFAQVLEMDASTPLTGLQAECVYEILKAGSHLLELINEVLDLARIEAGKTRLSIEPVDIGTIIEETMTIIMPTAAKYNIQVDADATFCSRKFVKADKVRLKQVLINLLTNAIKYNKPNGKVDFYCEESNDKVRFHVRDTGIGIPEAELEAIYKPFYRLNNMKNVVEGTGVGLAVVKQLVVMMGGVIHAESTEDEGSHFFIELPAVVEMTLWSERTDLKEKIEAEDNGFALNKKILYIEDNQANLRLVERVLELIPGTTFISAQTAEHGIELARRERPDVILLDINLPGMDGYEAFEELQEFEETENIPVIAVSSNAMEREIGRAIQMGFYDYITKPIKAELFFERIRRVFDRPQS